MRTLLQLCLLSVVSAVSVAEAQATNIARGAAYTLEPAPNYTYCTDPGDVTQLTDGVFTTDYFWTQASTVGWTNARPAIITIDLGADKPIRGVAYTTAAGAAGVNWPASIQLFVAGEDKQFRWAGDLVTLSNKKQAPPQEGYALHRFWTDELKIHGRYVALAALSEPFCFVDEIEVYEGDPAWLGASLEGEAIADIQAYIVRMAVRVAVQRRILQDCRDVAANASFIGRRRAPETTDAIAALLTSVEQDSANLPAIYPDDFRAILPLNEVHARVYRAQALLWQAEGLEPLTVWTSPLWGPLAPVSMPHAAGPARLNAAEPARLDVYMMQNEYRAASFNLSNATQEDMTLRLQFQDMPGGTAPSYVTVHRVEWTDTKAGKPVAAALPVIEASEGAYHVTVHPGLTQQIWLTFHPTDLAPGDYDARITIASKDIANEIPLALKGYPLQFPDKPRLHLGGWDYTDQPAMYGVTPENRAALVAHLKDHFVDSPWATSAAMPHGQYNNDGSMSAPPDTAHFDEWVGLWKGAAQYCVFAAVTDHIGSWKMGSPEFDRAATDWISFWSKHAEKNGIRPEQLVVLLFDEPSTPEHDAYTAGWAKPIRAANTGIRLWVDPTNRDMSITTSSSIVACDVVCPNRQIFYEAEQPYRDYFAALPSQGKALDFYSCSGPVRLLDPYAYHRLQAWDCWRYGGTSTFFWAFGDTGGGTSSNEYAAKGTCYTPLFLDATSVTAGKHMEACRESVEDYEYLAMLSDAIERAASKGADCALLERARALLRDAPVRVTDAIHGKGFDWSAELDRTAADTARKEILDMLVALAPAG